MSRTEVLKLLPAFKEKFFYTLDKGKIPYGIQRRGINPALPKTYGKVGYDWNMEGAVTDQLLLNHFSHRVTKDKNYEYASLATMWKEKPSIKWICLDFDHDWQIELRDKILAHLQSYGIDCLYEVSRENRSHNWFMLDHVPIDLAEKFMLQVMSELSLNRTKWEVYPLFQRRSALLRLPGGYHLKAEGVNGVLIGEEVVDTPEGIIQAFLDLPAHSPEFIKSLLKIPTEGTTVRPEKRKYERFIYLPREMPAPMPDLPRVVKYIASECQAYRKLIVDVVSNELIDKAGIDHHNGGLVLAKLSRYHDHKQGDGKGAEWWEKLATEYRSRDYDDHQWDARPGENPEANVWKCSTMERYFNLCEGCPFKKRGGFDSPKQLVFGEQIKKEKVGDVYEA